MEEKKIRKKRVLTQEHKDKIAQRRLGQKVSQATKDKISETVRNKEVSPKLSQSLLGKKKSLNHRENIRKAVEKQWQEFSDEERKRRIEALQNGQKTFDTSLEKKFERFLIERNIKYEKQKWVDRFRVDFFLQDHNTIFEIQGCYWHGCEQCGHTLDWQQEIVKSDNERRVILESKGYIVKFIWEHQLNG